MKTGSIASGSFEYSVCGYWLGHVKLVDNLNLSVSGVGRIFTVLLLILLFTTGCASTASIWLEDTNSNPCERSGFAYEGVKLDAKLIHSSFTDKDVSTWVIVPGLIDIIPSAIFDTIQLPFTIHADSKQQEYCSKYKEEKFIQQGPA